MDGANADPELVNGLAAWAAVRRRTRARLPAPEQVAAWARLAREAVVAGVAAYRDADGDAAGDAPSAELEDHAAAHIAEWVRLLNGGAVGDFDFVRHHARQLAGQGFPIEAALQAYRCMLPLLARWVATCCIAPRARHPEADEAALAALAAPYGAAVGIAFCTAYVAHAHVFAKAEGDRRAELLGILLRGFDASNAAVTRLLKRAGYLEHRLRFCVVLAQSTDPLEMENPARAQRIADAIAECLAPLQVRVLAGVSNHLVTAVCSHVRRVSGWTAPQADLVDRLKERLLGLGPAVLVGLSGDQAAPSLIPRGLHEATVALDFASVRDRVVPFYALSIRRLLIHRGAGYVQPALPLWLATLRDADATSRGALLATLRALADADMNVQAAARALGVHANTVYARLQRIQDLTGQNAQRYHDLSHLLLAADCGHL